MTRNAYLCSCNRTMPFAATALTDAARAAGADRVETFEAMCQHQLERFGAVLEGDAVVACTQEARLLTEVAADLPKVSTVRFFNIRETAGWATEAPFATPKLAALIASAMLPDAEPTTQVSYKSAGQTLIIGALADAVAVANLLKGSVPVSVLATSTAAGELAGELPVTRDFAVVTAPRSARQDGWARSTCSGSRRTRLTLTPARVAAPA